MIIKDISINDIDISEFNTRKNLAEGQDDSTIEDLAKSIEKQGLLSPITVFQRPDGKYALVAGQRRLLACKQLEWTTIPAIVRDTMSEADATAVSLIENVHRADMNPLDKARAFQTLLDKFGSLQSVSRETGVGVQTIRKYIQLLNLAPDLQQQLAAGETKGTQALARLAQQIEDPDKQTEVWKEIGGFRQDVQQEIIRRLDPDLDNLDELVDEASEGAFGVIRVRNCPYDCPTIPEPLKKKVASMIERYNS
jgi:ParB family transcriptional regulator, chromosome partitioning protein